jgi:hypothetical protein
MRHTSVPQAEFKPTAPRIAIIVLTTTVNVSGNLYYVFPKRARCNMVLMRSCRRHNKSFVNEADQHYRYRGFRRVLAGMAQYSSIPDRNRILLFTTTSTSVEPTQILI